MSDNLSVGTWGPSHPLCWHFTLTCMQNRTAGQSWLNSNSHIGSKNVCKIVHYSQQRLWEYQLISQSGLCVAFGFGWTWKYSLQTYRMAHSKWKETKQQASLLPGPAELGCNLVSFHFPWAILCPQAVVEWDLLVTKSGISGLAAWPWLCGRRQEAVPFRRMRGA